MIRKRVDIGPEARQTARPVGGAKRRGRRAMTTATDGKGKVISDGGLVYKGELREGKPHGRGKETFPDGRVYEGE